MTLTIYRNNTELLTQNIAADNVATFTHSLMAEHKVTCQFKSATPLDLKKKDYIIVDGVRFTLNLPPEVERTNIFTYSCTFESPLYTSYSKVFMDEGNAEFDYNAATPSDILQLWVDNMNSLPEAGWTIGQVDDAPVQNFTFSNVKCREALNTIATQFGLEYWVNNKEIHLVKKVGFDTSLRFQYGQGNGLYQLTRKNIDDKNIVTKLYAFGSDKNLDYTYGSKRLKLSAPLTQNTDLYGIEEGVVNFDDIYPHREGKVTAVGEGSLSITDSTLDFNINDYLIGGTTAKITFLDGDFAGVTFEIAANGYDPATKTIKFNPYTDDTGYTYPNDLRTARVGDTYSLLDILMPPSYVSAAEAELLARATEYLAENSVPRVAYGLQIDPINAKKKGISIGIGDRVKIVDTKLGINAQIRVTAISYPLYRPYQITATIADKVEPTLVQRLIAKDAENSTLIGQVDRNRIDGYRRGYQNQLRLQDLIFDPSGDYFDPGNFRPGSIETLMLSVGAKSQAFMLSGGRVTVSNDNLKAAFTATKLIHYNLKVDGLGSTWSIPSANLDIPDLDKPYYIYAKCSKTALTGTWVVSEGQILVDDIPGYYMLSVGAIYDVQDGFRGVGLTYGFASINGRIITAGRIQSLDGTIYFDLDSNQFFFGDASSSIDWNVSNERAVTLNGTLIQRAPGVVGPVPLDRGSYVPGQTYFPGDRVFYNGQTYLYIGDTATDNKAPTDTDYWQISAAKGETGPQGPKGDNGIKGDQGIPGTSSYFHVKYSANANGNPMSDTPSTYIGTAVTSNPTAPSSYTAYTWVRLEGAQGPDGDQGIPGVDGDNGQTSYLHLKYSNDNGETFTAGGGETPGDYLGQYVDFVQTDSTNPLDYNWAKIKGDKGDQGDQGPQGIQGLQGPKGDTGIAGTPGSDGRTTYFHVAYADTSTGGGFSQSPSNKAYIGTYVDFTEADSTNPSDYGWNKVEGLKGDQGIPGSNGEDGKTSYLHIAYATNSTGTAGFSTTVSAGKTYIGQYTDFTSADSTDPTKYKWTLIKGDKGDKGDPGVQGSPGTPGQDGASLFTWLKYADTPTSGMSDSPTGKKYMGIAYNKTTATESSAYADYQWSLIEGAKGDQGIPGVPGSDGQTTYTWVKYGTSASGAGISDSPTGKTYIGLAFNKTTATESSNPADYQWALIQGPKGDQGIQGSAGTPGQDGASLYTWVKYATSSTGANMSDSPTGKTYIGLAYNKTTPTESSTASDYAWSLFKGDQGVPGVPGSDGQSLYTWIKYATTPTSGMSDNPSGKAYIGFAFNKPSQTESTNYNDYTWSLIKGDKGDTGNDGAQGNYVEHRFAKNGSPTAAPTLATTNANPPGWTVAQPAVGLLEYMWMTTATKTASGALETNWSAPTRLSGLQGNNGPSLIPRGLWKDTTAYQGSAAGIDVVKYTDNIWYFARVDAGNIPIGTVPTNDTYWNEFGADFESVATNVFFAEKATINNLLVQTLETITKNENDIPIAHIVIDGSQSNPFILYDANGNQVLVMTILPEVSYGGEVITPSRAGIRVNEGASPSTGVAEMSTAGFFTNKGEQSWLPASSGISTNAGVVSLLNKRNNSNPIFPSGLSAAIVGIDNTDDSDGNSESYGGYFNSLFAGGACFGAVRVSANYTLSDKDLFVTIASGGNTIYLPAKPKKGQFYMIKNAGYSNNVLNDNSSSAKIIANSSAPQGSLNLWSGTNYFDMIFTWFDGVYWVASRFKID